MKERLTGEDGEVGNEGEDSEDRDVDRQLARLLVGRRAGRQRRMRRALIAHLRNEAD